MRIYSVYDAGGEAYMQPWFVQAEGVAKREFGNLVNDKSHPVGKHPEDYTLFFIGIWKEVTGELKGQEPESCGNGLSYKNGNLLDKLREEEVAEMVQRIAE